MKKQKLKKKNFRKSPHRLDKLKKLEKEDRFLDDDVKVNLEDAIVSHPSQDDIQDLVRDMDGYRDFARMNRGNGLTFGDY